MMHDRNCNLIIRFTIILQIEHALLSPSRCVNFAYFVIFFFDDCTDIYIK